MAFVICLACRFRRDSPEDQSPGAPLPPARGDFWLCRHCGQLHRFTGEYGVDRGRVNLLAVRIVDLLELGELAEPARSKLLADRERILEGKGTGPQ